MLAFGLRCAREMAAALADLGFAVETQLDSKRKDMRLAIKNFLQSLDRDAVGLVFFSGHGLQLHGVNYLLPVDFKLEGASNSKKEPVSISSLLNMMVKQGALISAIVVDAGHANSFATAAQASGAQGASALGPMAVPKGSLVALSSASAGMVEERFCNVRPASGHRGALARHGLVHQGLRGG